jgi:hypothetical protein
MIDSEFLSTFTRLQRTKLFDASWTVSSQWLKVFMRTFPGARRFVTPRARLSD